MFVGISPELSDSASFETEIESIGPCSRSTSNWHEVVSWLSASLRNDRRFLLKPEEVDITYLLVKAPSTAVRLRRLGAGSGEQLNHEGRLSTSGWHPSPPSTGGTFHLYSVESLLTIATSLQFWQNNNIALDPKDHFHLKSLYNSSSHLFKAIFSFLSLSEGTLCSTICRSS